MAKMSESKTTQKAVAHIEKEGSSFHVLSYSLTNGNAVIKCSDPHCELNLPIEDRVKFIIERMEKK